MQARPVFALALAMLLSFSTVLINRTAFAAAAKPATGIAITPPEETEPDTSIDDETSSEPTPEPEEADDVCGNCDLLNSLQTPILKKEKRAVWEAAEKMLMIEFSRSPMKRDQEMTAVLNLTLVGIASGQDIGYIEDAFYGIFILWSNDVERQTKGFPQDKQQMLAVAIQHAFIRAANLAKDETLEGSDEDSDSASDTVSDTNWNSKFATSVLNLDGKLLLAPTVDRARPACPLCQKLDNARNQIIKRSKKSYDDAEDILIRMKLSKDKALRQREIESILKLAALTFAKNGGDVGAESIFSWYQQHPLEFKAVLLRMPRAEARMIQKVLNEWQANSGGGNG